MEGIEVFPFEHKPFRRGVINNVERPKSPKLLKLRRCTNILGGSVPGIAERCISWDGIACDKTSVLGINHPAWNVVLSPTCDGFYPTMNRLGTMIVIKTMVATASRGAVAFVTDFEPFMKGLDERIKYSEVDAIARSQG